MPDPSQTPPTTPPPVPPSPPQTPPGPAADEKSVADLVFDVSQGTSSLIREELELAKAEVTEKVGKLLRGSVVGIAAGVFAFLALILVMEGIAWLLNEEVFDGKAWPGFFIEAAVFLLIAAAAGAIAYKAVKAGSPPVPEQAIEEAKLTKTMFEREAESTAENVQHSVVKGGGK
ncbi:MAG: phage holin family protein [Solirubrobacterales bacterium]